MPEAPVEHNHFGRRHTAGCPKCEEMKAAKAQTQTVEATGATPGVYLTFDQLQELLAAKAESNGDLTEALKAFAKELKAPTEEEQLKKEDAQKRRDQQRARAIEAAAAAEEAKRQREAACEQLGHRKDEGRSTKSAIVQGQVYNDGTIRPFCLTCGKQWPPRKARMEEMTAVG